MTKKEETMHIEEQDAPIVSEKEVLYMLHDELKKRKITRMSDLEGLIARAE